MGTTATALRTGQGVRLGFVLAIEGYANLLCDAKSVAQVVTAWAGTSWTAALPGLHVLGKLRRSIRPWQDVLDIPTMTFAIQPDTADTFATAVWRTTPNYRTRLTAGFFPAADGSGSIAVQGTAGFPASGTVYVGNTAVTYSATTATSFTVPAGGARALFPFTADGANHYSRPLEVPQNFNSDQSANPRVQDVPPTWIGRRVALYAHRIVGEVWDTKAQAQLEFAGRVIALSEDNEGRTVLDCEDLAADLRDCVLMRDQWIGYVEPGIMLRAGERLKFMTSPVLFQLFTVVASGASGTDEINAGRYQLEELVSAIDQWLANAILEGSWSAGVQMRNGGRRLVIAGQGSSATEIERVEFFYGNGGLDIAEFLGFNTFHGISGYTIDDGTNWEVVSPAPPYRIKPVQGRLSAAPLPLTIDLAATESAWVDTDSFFPPPFDAAITAGQHWGFIAVGESIYLCRYVSATELADVTPVTGFAGIVNDQVNGNSFAGVTVDDDADSFAIRQVVVLAGALSELLPSLIASTGGGSNHATYDVFPSGLSCPAIPWSLLGDEFLDSCRALEQATKSDGYLLVLDRPRRLIDELLPELAARFAWLVFRDGGYVLASPPTPNPLESDHTFDETNKAAAPGDRDALRANTRVTDEFLRNVITLQHDRDLSGKYTKSTSLRDTASITDHGGPREVTIKLPSSYIDAAGAGASVEDLSAALLARCLPAWGRPMKLVTRTIAHTHYHVAPGDTGSLSDDVARDPVTGRRGLVIRGCVVLAVTHDFGHEGGEPFGEVELLLTDEDRTFPLAPCAEVDAGYSSAGFTAGYHAVDGRLRTVAFQHSRMLDGADVSRFVAGDKVLIVEVDPPDPAAPLSWERDVQSVNAASYELTLATTLSSPAFDATKQYRLTPQKFSQVVAGQKDASFLAGTDGLVEDLALPNLWAEDNPGGDSFFGLATFNKFRRIANLQYQEGRPFHAGLGADLIRNVNALLSYGQAQCMPLAFGNTGFTNDTDYKLVAVLPFHVGGSDVGRRTLRIAVHLIAEPTGTIWCRVTSSSRAPAGDTGEATVWPGPKTQITFTGSTAGDGAVTAEQALQIVMSDVPGRTWLTFEMKTTAGITAIIRAVPRLYLGPVTA